MRKGVFTALLLGVALSTSAAAEEPQTATADADAVTSIDVKPGDSWVYRIENEITGQVTSTNTYTVTEMTGGAISVFASIDEGGGRETKSGSGQFTSDWGLLRRGPWRYNKPDQTFGIPLPLKVGAKWKSSFDANRSGPNEGFHGVVTSTAVDREKLTVPNGDSYNAFQIRSEETIKPLNGASKIATKVTLWYDPAVNRYVERDTETRADGLLTHKDKEYLISYSRKTDG
jgi:hypothetical protein